MGISIDQCREIIKSVLYLPDAERLESLKKLQQEKGINPNEFISKLLATWKHYKKDFKIPDPRCRYTKEIIEGVEVEVPIIPEYLTPEELDAIKPTLEQLKNENVIYLSTNREVYEYPFDKAGIPENIVYDCLNPFNPYPKTKLSIEGREQWETRYKKWLDEYDHIRVLLLAKGIEYAEIILNHCQQYEPNDLHQIDSLQRRIFTAKRLVGIDQGKGLKKEPQKNEVPAHHVEALYLFYTNQSVTKDNSERSIFNKWTLWRDEKKRTTVGPIVGFKTKIKHLTSVNIWLQNEGKRKEAAQCQKDIDKLRENYNKP